MTTKSTLPVAIFGAAAMLLAAPLAAHADVPGKHPGFLHALTDLRSARWLIKHRAGDAAVSAHEDVAVQYITAALSDIQRAAIDDGKNLEDHPAIDAPPSRQGRLQRAMEALQAAHKDIDAEEDDPAARELRKVAFKNIDAAMEEVKGALWDAGHGH